MRTRISAILLALLVGAGPASAENCREVSFEGAGFVVCTARAGQDLRLFLTAPDGAPVGQFDRLERLAQTQGKTVAFAMNAGMYHPDRRPVGLFQAEDEKAGRLQTRASTGNFGMLPNGVFCIAEGRFSVVESRHYAGAPPDCRYATQSGPMLVIDGKLHPRFSPGSTSRYLRNGVGVSADGRTAWFAISDRPVTFHQFARLFRDRLGAPNALYFDGNVSRLYAPELDRADIGLAMGPIVALLRPEG
jgi:uncharacterized protein YigE (DUF2233 family)